MSNVTITMPLSEYEKLKREAKESDIRRFISSEYTDFEKNEFHLQLNVKALREYLDIRPEVEIRL